MNLMLGLSAYLVLTPRPEEIALLVAKDGECDVMDIGGDGREVCYTIAVIGTELSYRLPPSGITHNVPHNVLAMLVGSSLTGLCIGEVILSYLALGCYMPISIVGSASVASLTSVARC